MRKELQIILGISKKEQYLVTAELRFNNLKDEVELNFDTHSFVKYYDDPSDEIEKMRDNYLDSYPVDFSGCYELWEVKDKIRSIEDNFIFSNGFFNMVDCSCSGNVVLDVSGTDYALYSQGCGSSFIKLIKDKDFIFIHDKVKEGIDTIYNKYTPLIKSEEDIDKYKEEINELFKFDNFDFSCIGGYVCEECKESLEVVLEKLEEEELGFMENITSPTPYLD